MEKIVIYVIAPILFIISGVLSSYNIDVAIPFVELSIILTVAFAISEFKKIHSTVLNLHSIFLVVFAFFLISRVLFDLLGFKELGQPSLFNNYTVPDTIIFRTLINIYLALISYIYASQYVLYYLSRSPQKKDIGGDRNLFKISSFLFLLTLPFLLLYIYHTISFIREYGYIAFHRGATIENHSFYKLITIVSSVSYFSFIVSNPRSGRLYWYFTIIMIVTFMADGRRGPGMTLALIALWYYVHYKQIKLGYSKIILIVSGTISVLITIGAMRFRGQSVENIDLDFLNFIYKQGISVQVISFAIKHDSSLVYNVFDLVFGKLHQFIEIMFYKVRGVSPDLSLETRAEYYKIYSSYISYTVNKELYLNGFGTGGSYVAQLYSVGKEGAQVLGGLIFGGLYTIFAQWANSSSTYKRGMLLLLLPVIVYIPRDNMFDFTVDFMYFFIIFTSIFFVKQILEKYSQRKVLV